MFGQELTDFLESGCALIVGAVTRDGEPFATRGWGLEVLAPRGTRVRVLLGAGAVRRVDAQRDDGRSWAIAVTGADVRTLRSVQLKGTVDTVEPVTDADLSRSARYRTELFEALEELEEGPRALLERLPPADLVACTVTVAEAYDQTPGPGAGAPMPAVDR